MTVNADVMKSFFYDKLYVGGAGSFMPKDFFIDDLLKAMPLTRGEENNIFSLYNMIVGAMFTDQPKAAISAAPILEIPASYIKEIDYAIVFFRRCLGDGLLLNVIGDPRKKGITHDNNPSIDLSGYNKESITTRLYYYGNIDPEDRIVWYLGSFFFGLKYGHTVPRAHVNAMTFIRTFGAVNYPHLQALDSYPDSYSHPTSLALQTEDSAISQTADHVYYFPGELIDKTESLKSIVDYSFVPDNQKKYVGYLENCLRLYFVDTVKRKFPDIYEKYLKKDEVSPETQVKEPAASGDLIFWLTGAAFLAGSMLKGKSK